MRDTVHVRSRLIATAGALAIASALASAAQAQAVPTPGQPPSQAGAPAASTATVAEPTPAATAGEVVVTAQRRSENVQKVPVAVSVVSAGALQTAAIFNAESLQQVVPSLSFKKGTSNVNSTLAIRGIGTQSFAAGAEPSVSTVVDGVVYGRSGQAFQEFSDLDHIEVLRGPQGTLFGKNANAGLINIVSKAPSRTFEGDASAGYFEGGEVRATGDVSGPITDRIAYRLSGVYGDYRGNIFNYGSDKFTNGYHRLGARGSIVADVTDDLRITLRADYTHATDNCCADVLGTSVPSAQLNNVFLPLLKPTTPGQTNETVNNDTSPRTTDDNGGASGQVDYKVGGFTLTSISAWRDWRNKQVRDGDFGDTFGQFVATAGAGRTAAGMNLQQADVGELNFNQFSQEFRITSPSTGRLQYVAGAFLWYTTEGDAFRRSDQECIASTLPVNAQGFQPCAPGISTFLNISGPANFRTKFYNQALYGQATYDITDQLRVTGGVRYTNDRVSYHLNRFLPASPVAAPGINSTFASRGAVTDDGPSAKAAVQYDVLPNINTYASYSHGYKGPAFNVFYNQTANNTAPIAPETSDSYEVGVKTQFLQHKLTLNLAAFNERFYNFQANSFVLVNGTTVTSLTNAGAVRSEGVELEGTWRPFRDLTFTGGYTYDDAIIVSYICPTNLSAANRATCLAHNGQRLPFAPRHKLDVTGDWRLPFSESLPFETRLVSTYSYQSEDNFDIDQTPLARQPAYALVDASLIFSTKDEKYHLSVIAKNLANQFYTTFITPSGNGIASGSYTRLQIPRDANRFVGVLLQANF